jgi:hypothetical protein
MPTVTERFTKLGQQVEAAEANLSSTASEDRAKLEAKIATARKKADDHAELMQANAQETSERIEDQWRDLLNSWDQHRQRIHARIEEKKAEHDAKQAANRAEDAELDAIDAIEFAAMAIEEAEYSVLDALASMVEAEEVSAAA